MVFFLTFHDLSGYSVRAMQGLLGITVLRVVAVAISPVGSAGNFAC